MAEQEKLTLLVSEGGPFESLPILADACRELVREELINASHENARDRLTKLDWRGVYIEATLQRWRTPCAVARRIETCPEFDEEVMALPANDQAAVRDVLAAIRRGDDITTLLSRWATKADPRRGDRFLADWHLHHVHIRPSSGDLLFIHFSEDAARVVAIRPHDSWAENELLHRIQRNWPGLIFTGTLAGSRPSVSVSDEDLKQLQQAGVNVLMADKRGYAVMGKGLTATGHPMILIDFANHLQHVLDELASGRIDEVVDPRDWKPCLTEDLRWLALWDASGPRLLRLASLWPFAS